MNNQLSDPPIRNALHSYLRRRYKNRPETLIIDELGIVQGSARIDLAVINGGMSGYEIKSDTDNLRRLATQAHEYNRVFDRMNIVVTARYLATIGAEIPDWWGVYVAESSGDGVTIRQVRAGKKNPKPDPAAIVQLLWRDEACSALRDLGVPKPTLRARRAVMWTELVRMLSITSLRRLVRAAVSSRSDWRSALLHMPSGA